MTTRQPADTNESEQIRQKRIDGYINRDIGAIIDMLLKDDSDMTIQTAFKLLYSTRLYADLSNHQTCYYLLDTLELYNKLKSELNG